MNGLNDLIRGIREGGDPPGDVDSRLTLLPEQARELLAAYESSRESRHSHVGRLPGEVKGDVRYNGKLDIVQTGVVEGRLQVALDGHDLAVEGDVSGDVVVYSVGRVVVQGSVGGDLYLEGDVREVRIADGGKVNGDVIVLSDSVVGRLEVEVEGNVGGSVFPGEVDYKGYPGRFAETVLIEGKIEGNVTLLRPQREVILAGEVGGDVTFLEPKPDVEADGEAGEATGPRDLGAVQLIRLRGHVRGSLRVHDQVGQFLMDGRVGGELTFSDESVVDHLVLEPEGEVLGPLQIAGQIAGDVELRGRVAGRAVLTPTSSMRLVSIRGARFGDEVFVGDGVSIADCDFRQCADIDRLNLVGSSLFPKNVRALANPPAGLRMERIPDHEMASIYRQLRSNLEGRKNRAASGNFYVGEMEARLADAWANRRVSEASVLWLYRLVSMYGQRIWRPLVAFLGVAILGTFLLDLGGFHPDACCEAAPLVDTFMFALRSMLSFLNPPEADLSNWELTVQIGLRVTGPILVALTALAVRERVAR